MDALRNSKNNSLLAVASLFLFTFFNLILDAPRIYVLCGQYFVECENTWIWSGSDGSCSVGSRLVASSCKPIELAQYHPTKYIFFDTYSSLSNLPHWSSRYVIHQYPLTVPPTISHTHHPNFISLTFLSHFLTTPSHHSSGHCHFIIQFHLCPQ
jgi:hypothetical protein